MSRFLSNHLHNNLLLLHLSLYLAFIDAVYFILSLFTLSVSLHCCFSKDALLLPFYLLYVQIFNMLYTATNSFSLSPQSGERITGNKTRPNIITDKVYNHKDNNYTAIKRVCVYGSVLSRVLHDHLFECTRL